MNRRLLELKGSPKEIGEKHGLEHRHLIRESYDFYCRRHNKKPEFLHPSISEYLKKHFLYLYEEMEGIASGAGMKTEEILVYNHFNVIAPGCTPVFMRSKKDGPLLGQNLDCGKEEQEATIIRRVHPTEGLSFLCASLAGTVWAGNWVNQSGLCQAGVSAHHQNYMDKDGTAWSIIGRDIAQKAATVKEAAEISAYHTGIGKIGIFIYADDSGDAVTIEKDNFQHFVSPIEENFAFSTGLFLSGIKAQNEPEYLRIKEERSKTIERLYNEGKVELSMQGMQRLLSYHSHTGSVCRHAPWESHRSDTLTRSTRIIQIKSRKLFITDGPPCKNKFWEYHLM